MNFTKKIYHIQATPRPSRACTKNLNAGAYCDFLFDDDDGSDTDEDVGGQADSDVDLDYDPSVQGEAQYDKKRGKDSWVGRRVIKNFEQHGDFDGIIYGVDEDADTDGYRLFLVHYFLDPEDGEAMWPEELVR